MLIAYGEDAATLLLVGGHVTAFVTALEGAAPAEVPRVIYRPSFGRRATKRAPDGTPIGSERALFGEFDAIVGTARGTYLIEAKWPSSGRVAADNVLELDARQLRRHAVMVQYLAAWRTPPASWTEVASPEERWHTFTAQSDIKARLRPYGVSVPGPQTVLARTLARVLRILNGCGPVHDVVLFARTLHDLEGGIPRNRPLWPRGVRSSSFTLVVADLRHDQLDGFVELPTLTIDAPHWVEFARV